MQVPNATSPFTSISSGTSASNDAGNSSAPSFQSLLSQLTGYVNETPAQRMYNAILAQLGITPQQLASMSPQDKQKVEEKIQELMKKEMQAQQQQQQQEQQQTQAQTQTQVQQSVSPQGSQDKSASSSKHVIPMINFLG